MRKSRASLGIHTIVSRVITDHLHACICMCVGVYMTVCMCMRYSVREVPKLVQEC